MPRLPQFDPIEYLVWKRHPAARFGEPAVDSSGIPSPGRQEALRAADDYRDQLHEMAKEELDRLVEEERADDAERDRQKKLADEAARPFNQPQAQADFEYWAKMSVWSVDEAVALSLGRDPRHVTLKLVESYAKVSAFASLFTDRRNLIRRAVAARQLDEFMTPGAFLAWADRFKLTIPDALTKAVTDLGIEIADWKTRYDEALALVTALREERQQNHDRHMAAVKDHSETIDKFRRHMEDVATGHQRLIAGKDELIASKIEELTEDEAITEQERLKRKWATIEALVGSKKRLELIAADLVRHFEARTAALDGKAMIVCMSRRICVALYNEIVALRPDWHSRDDEAGSIKVVMTGSASDPQDWQPHIGTKGRRDLLAKRAKDPADPLRLVIVRDMWLTGFDAPSMHTMYVDKPMKGHGLMQAIARVNRVFRDKPAGLVVDYIGIGDNLKRALQQYSGADQRQAGIDEAVAVAALLETFEVVDAIFHGFDYARGLSGTPQQRLVVLAEAIEWVLARQHEDAARETTEEGKRKANRRFQDAVLGLSRAFALASASDEARAIRDEVGFFQAVRAALVKSAEAGPRSGADRDFAIQQLLDRAVVSTEIVDILAAAGIKTPDISILSDEFLAEIQQLEKRNLALEALEKLLNGELRSRTRTNVVETRRFSERLEEAIARYHSNAITTVEVIQRLIDLAKDLRAALRRGEEEGLTQEEIAFYDALAENESAVEAMGNDSLKVIAHELLESLKGNVTVDWSHRESARARMCVLVKHILRRHGYPPDLQDAAVQTVLRQAEALSASWAG